jgi:peptidyl-prolyl cis-trans isomerase A (cyclophilin A)
MTLSMLLRLPHPSRLSAFALLLILLAFNQRAESTTIVTVNTVLGTFEMVMLEDDAPNTVENFLNYVERADFDGTFFHRSVENFVLQGGGFTFDPDIGQLVEVVTDPPVANEFKQSNLRGTVAMAKFGNDPDSATSQWFVNVANNSLILDPQNGGFTVFARVIGDGMAVVDAISRLQVINLGGVLTDLPVIDFNRIVHEGIFAVITSVTMREDADSDGDGVGDTLDQLPNDPNETLDTDGDMIGNIADLDDDGDGMPDSFENDNGFDALDASDAGSDSDGDGVSNLAEYEGGTDPNDADDVGDVCLVGIGASELTSFLAFETRVNFANPASNIDRQSILRIINDSDVEASLEIYGLDDAGVRSRRGPVSLTVAPRAVLHLPVEELETGSDNLTGSLCDGAGKWQFRIRSSIEIEIMSLLETPDGFLTTMDDTVAGDNVYFFNPGDNIRQESILRVINPTRFSGTVTITATDDAGMASADAVTFFLEPHAAKQVTAWDLENGNEAKGLSGTLGDGTGKWRLNVTSTMGVRLMSLLRSPDGYLANMSTPVESFTADSEVIFANPASNEIQSSFLRLINPTSEDATVIISGIDDTGAIAPAGDVMLVLPAGQSAQVTLADLESGNTDKGLIGTLGNGQGLWRLNVSADTNVEIMSLVRSPDGFVTNMSRTVPAITGVNNVWFFNPASNTDQESVLRLVNTSVSAGTLNLSAMDDDGNDADGTITIDLDAGAAKQVSASDLESGNATLGVVGQFGNGSGRWRLRITSSVNVSSQSLLQTPDGLLTNMSRAAE